MSTQSKPYLTPEQYLEIERKAEFKSEYYQGEMFAMSGARRAHNLIVTNVLRELSTHLRGGPCEVYPSEMRVHVTPAGLYTYPDIVVVCGEPQFLDGEFDTLLNPKIIVEILSASTEDFDRGKKSDMYRALPSLAEYVMISSLRVRAERFTREADGTWNYDDKTNRDDSIHLKSIDCHLLLAYVYEKVDISGQEPR
jgi:Uma2 family endonuclease